MRGTFVVALEGVPGAGKTTLVPKVVASLVASGRRAVGLVDLDRFDPDLHLDEDSEFCAPELHWVRAARLAGALAEVSLGPWWVAVIDTAPSFLVRDARRMLGNDPMLGAFLYAVDRMVDLTVTIAPWSDEMPEDGNRSRAVYEDMVGLYGGRPGVRDPDEVASLIIASMSTRPVGRRRSTA